MNELPIDAHLIVSFVEFSGMEDCPAWWQNFIDKSGYLLNDSAAWEMGLNKFLAPYDAYVVVNQKDDDVDYVVFKTETGATMIMLTYA